MPVPSHELVQKLFPLAAAVLPRSRFETLAGNGLDRDIIVRQSLSGETQWVYVINPGWWWVRAVLKIESDKERTIRDPVLRTGVPSCREKDGSVITLDLKPWSIKVLTIQPPTGVLCATVYPDEAVIARVEQAKRDIEAALPYLATRRPNLIPNGDFEQVDSKGMPIGWRLYGWHTANLDCGTDFKEGPPPNRVLRLNNKKASGTIGIYSAKFALAPGREYTYLARLAADRPNIQGRIALVGERYISQTYALDTRWREVSFVWPAAQTASLQPGAKMRAEVHNDSRGIIYADALRLVDSTFFSYADSVATEQAVAELFKTPPGTDLCKTFATLANPRITRLLEMVKRRRAGNEWLLIGPFDSAAGGLNGVYPPETDFLAGTDLTSITYVGKDKREVKGFIDWTIKNFDAPDYIDLQAAIGPFDASEAFAFTHIYSDANKKAKFLIGCDDGIKVWLNDTAVFTQGGERAAKPAEFVVPVTLRRGWNRVLVKVENIQKDWGFFFTLADESGVRVPRPRYAINPAK